MVCLFPIVIPKQFLPSTSVYIFLLSIVCSLFVTVILIRLWFQLEYLATSNWQTRLGIYSSLCSLSDAIWALGPWAMWACGPVGSEPRGAGPLGSMLLGAGPLGAGLDVRRLRALGESDQHPPPPRDE